MNIKRLITVLFLIASPLIWASCWEVEFNQEGKSSGPTDESSNDMFDDYFNQCLSAASVPLDCGVVLYKFNNRDFYFFKVAITGNGTLTLSSTGTSDPKVSLLDNECGQIASNDDISAGDTNFSLSQAVTAGTTYRIRINFKKTGTFRMVTQFTP